MNRRSDNRQITDLSGPSFSFFNDLIVALLITFSIFFTSKNCFATIKSESDIVSVSYISGWMKGNSQTQGALRFKLKEGWKTYWKQPGTFGVRPFIDWSQSTNIKNIKFFWPVPKIFKQNNVKVIGYANDLVIPMKITKTIPNESAFLDMKLEFGVCSDICVLKTATIRTQTNIQASGENLNLISEALKKTPSKITDDALSLVECSITKSEEDFNVRYSIRLLKEPESKPIIIMEYNRSDEYLENQTITLEGKDLSMEASLINIYAREGIIERNKLSATLLLEGRGFKLVGCS